MQIPQCAETILHANTDDGLCVGDGLLHHERSVVLLVDAAQDEAAAVDVDKNGEFGHGRGRGLEGVEGHIDLEDQTFEFVGDGSRVVARRGTACCGGGREGLRTCVAGVDD